MPEFSIEKQMIQGLLDSLTLTDENIVKTDSFSPENTLDGAGVVTAEITRMENANPGLPDYFAYVSILGMTFASVDTSKETVRNLYDDVLRSYSAWTPETLSENLGVNVVGIQPITNSAIREGENRYAFTIDFKLVIVDLNF